ncbi:hypothetical protein [Nocardia sp. NPDC057455]|uniref:hypothetical protein n=1 Tax=Nocardia sp. NPDC057455 TaxID=3346138 RepID=UPI0036710012
MNPLLLIGGAVLAVGLLGLILSVLLRPAGPKAHVSVADLQARLANESATSPEADASADEDQQADRPDAASVGPDDAERKRLHTDDPRDKAADPASADDHTVLLPDHRRRDG